MKMKFIISTFLVIAIFNLLGCHSAPIQERGIRASHDKKLDYTEEDVAKLIMRAGASTPWRLEQLLILGRVIASNTSEAPAISNMARGKSMKTTITG